MNTSAPDPPNEHATSRVMFGSGWLWPTAFVATFIALMYLPDHNRASPSADILLPTIAALYVVGLSIVGVRLLRGTILQIGGSHDPIVLLGRGPDPLISPVVGPRWRLLAVAAGSLAQLAAAAGAARLATVVDPTTNAHAIAGLALGVNAVMAAGVLVPAPGFPGWALVLGVIDMAGARPDQRVRRAARVAQTAVAPIGLAVGAGAVLLGDPLLLFFGVVLSLMIWSGSHAATSQDAAVRFLAAHAAGEVARPLSSSATPQEPLDDMMARLRPNNVVVAVEAGGGVLGAIGPRQLVARQVAMGETACTQAMVPLGSLRVFGAASPAVALLPEIARHGFALVAGSDGLSYVEAADLAQQVRIWVSLSDRRAADAARRAIEPN